MGGILSRTLDGQPLGRPAGFHGRLLKRGLVCSALVASILAGCRSEGPERVVVSGTVTYRGQPIETGQIRFIPAHGTPTPTSGAEIINGTYAATARGGVPLGTHRVEIIARRPDPKFRQPAESLPSNAMDVQRSPQQQYIPAKYNTSTELEITIAPGSRKIIRDFHLTD